MDNSHDNVANLPSQIATIMLGVEDIARSVEFYRDTLALKLGHQSAELAFFAAGGVTLALSAPLGRTRAQRSGAIEIIFPVASVRTAYALLTQRGCAFINQPREVTPGSWAATFTDPDSHQLTLFGPG